VEIQSDMQTGLLSE